VSDMYNWRHRVEDAITGKFSLRQDGSAYVGFNKDVVKVINKCRIKYSGCRDMKHSSGNTFNSNKTYDVNGTTYRVTYNIYPDQCGRLQRQRNKRQQKVFKCVEKKNIFNSFDEVPEKFENRIDFRTTDPEGTKVVVWEFIRGGY
tara:strand:- start:158 stop:592 length:435 start_codon:yes stop_codon:yes gene_type:complete